LINIVKNTLSESGTALEGRNLLLAVSGGADSMAMLHLFAKNKDEFGYASISVFHYNHGLRGKDSDEDEEVVKRFCCILDVPFISHEGKLLERQKPKGLSIESWAREERYYALEKQASPNNSLIFTAHNKNDSVETVIFNLLRGSGLGGLKGIGNRGNIVRPLIEVERKEIVKYCETNNVPFRTDKSNFENHYSRNRIRNIIIPEMDIINSSVVNNISRLSKNVSEIDDFLFLTAEKLLESSKAIIGKKECFDADVLNNADTIIVKYCIRSILGDEINNLSNKIIDECLAVITGEKNSVQISSSKVFLRKDNFVSLDELKPKRDNFENSYKTVCKTGKNVLPSGKMILVERFDNTSLDTENINKFEYQNSIDCDKISGVLFFRSREKGDSFRSLRRNNTKTLKKLFNEIGIDPTVRWCYPILADDVGVVWVLGEGVSDRVKLSESTKDFISLKEYGESDAK
jgi:tRNA(Ile)-lysidine synthase